MVATNDLSVDARAAVVAALESQADDCIKSAVFHEGLNRLAPSPEMAAIAETFRSVAARLRNHAGKLKASALCALSL